MNVVVTPQSQADIETIAESYESYGVSPLRFLSSISHAVAHLQAYPDTAVRRRDLSRRDVYFWLVDPYWMVVRHTENALYVLTVMHASRKLGKTIHQRLKDLDD